MNKINWLDVYGQIIAGVIAGVIVALLLGVFGYVLNNKTVLVLILIALAWVVCFIVYSYKQTSGTEEASEAKFPNISPRARRLAWYGMISIPIMTFTTLGVFGYLWLRQITIILPSTPDPSATAAASTLTPTEMPTSTSTETPTGTVTPSPSATDTPSPSPTVTDTPAPTETPPPSPTVTPSPTDTPTPTLIPTRRPASPTRTPTPRDGNEGGGGDEPPPEPTPPTPIVLFHSIP